MLILKQQGLQNFAKRTLKATMKIILLGGRRVQDGEHVIKKKKKKENYSMVILFGYSVV